MYIIHIIYLCVCLGACVHVRTLCTADVTSQILDLTKLKILVSYDALSCSRKGVKFSNFCVLRITGCQNGSQKLLSKFSSLFARTEQAEE